MMTEREVVQQIEELVPSSADPMGATAATLVRFLKYRWAKPFLKEGVTREQWNAKRVPLNRGAVLQVMKEFQPVAWRGANARNDRYCAVSLYTIKALVWLMGDDGDVEFAMGLWRGYAFHGKPMLVAWGERYGLGPYQPLDDGNWVLNPHVVLTAQEALPRWRMSNPM